VDGVDGVDHGLLAASATPAHMLHVRLPTGLLRLPTGPLRLPTGHRSTSGPLWFFRVGTCLSYL
jgi:hypothetical protein